MVTLDSQTSEGRREAFERFCALYMEAIAQHPGEWYAIEGGFLYTGKDRSAVSSALASDGKDPRDVRIDRVPVPEPTMHYV
jgi:hypothetical protein